MLKMEIINIKKMSLKFMTYIICLLKSTSLNYAKLAEVRIQNAYISKLHFLQVFGF